MDINKHNEELAELEKLPIWLLTLALELHNHKREAEGGKNDKK